MTPSPLVICETSEISEAIERMSARAVRRAPVVNNARDLVGIVSFDDLLPVLAEKVNALARLTGGQSKRERHVLESATQERRRRGSGVLWQMLFGD